MGRDLNDIHRDEGEGMARAALDAAVPFKPGQTNGATTTSFEWGEPEPLEQEMKPRPYPIEALPAGICEAVKEVADYAQCPAALAGCSALAQLSLAGQGTVNVDRDEGLSGPTSLFFLVVAKSGERKSHVDNKFNGGTRDYEREQGELFEPRKKDYQAALSVWDGKKLGIERAITAAVKKGEDTSEWEKKRRDHEAVKPIAPRVPRLLYEDATSEALAYQLSTGWPSAAIISSEGGTVIGSHSMQPDTIMRSLSLFNSLWSGDRYTLARRTTKASLSMVPV